jgi:hypothetical protein
MSTNVLTIGYERKRRARNNKKEVYLLPKRRDKFQFTKMWLTRRRAHFRGLGREETGFH